MLNAAALTREGKLDAPAIDSAQADAASLLPMLSSATAPEQSAALAIIAGRLRLAETATALVDRLGCDGAAGKAAAWALGQLAAAGNGIEAAVLAAIATGDLDTRENGYLALAVLAARGVASATLAEAVSARVQAEIDRAKSGGSGLGEHACRVLAVLGAPRLGELIQRVIENDRFCDRFELQRLRKASEDGGRDQETLRLLGGPWTTVFADHIYHAPVAKAEAPSAPAKGAPASAKGAPAPGKGIPAPAKGAAAKAPSAPGSPAPAAGSPTAGAGGPGDDLAEDGAEEGIAEEGQLLPIDWQAFVASPEGQALTPQLQQMSTQLGPLLEQLSARAIRAALNDLTGQEFAALLLQVLPQALPPQHVQMALSPPAVNTYQAMVKYLARTGLATNGQELIDAVKLVRQELTKQIRQAGILGGPDYSDPDDKPAPA